MELYYFHIMLATAFYLRLKKKSCLGKVIWPYKCTANSQKAQMKMNT